MKKIISAIIFSILLLVFSGCTIGYSVNKFFALNDKIEFLDYSKEAIIYYYDKKDVSFELETNKFGKYDNDYFNDKSLIIITIIDDEKIEFSLLNIKNNKIAISRDNIGEEKLINWTLIIEVEGKISDASNLCVSFMDKTFHEHSYIQSIIEPTCCSQGYTQYQCNCGYSYNDNYTDVIKCKYINGVCIWCKNDDLINSYNISEHSEDLVNTTIGLFYDGSSQMEGCGYKNISSLFYRFEKNQLDEFKYIDMTSEFDEYYTCCYFNSRKKNLLDSIENIELEEFEDAYYKQPWGAWSGINYYLARFHLYNYLQGGMNHEKSLIKMDDIKWIEIPKNEIIPSEIDNYFLIAITESKTVIETSIFGNEIKEYKWYFESKHLYDDGLVYPEYDEFYNDWINQKYLIDYCSFATLICNNTLNSFSGLHLLKYDSLRIQEIDGINYIRTSYDNTLWGEQNLIDILEYKKEVVDDNISYYWFKYEDIIELLAGD